MPRHVWLVLGLLMCIGCKQLNYIPSSLHIPAVDSAGQLAVDAYAGAGAFEFAQAGGTLTATPWKGLLVQLQGSGYTSGTSGFIYGRNIAPNAWGWVSDTSYSNRNLTRRGNGLGGAIGWMFNTSRSGNIFLTGGFSSEFTSRSLSQSVMDRRDFSMSVNTFYGATRSSRYWAQMGIRALIRHFPGTATRENMLISMRMSVWQIRQSSVDFHNISGLIDAFEPEFVKLPAQPRPLPEVMVGYELASQHLSGQAQVSYAFTNRMYNWLAPPFLSIRLGLTYRLGLDRQKGLRFW